jgi:hypothetical protein
MERGLGGPQRVSDSSEEKSLAPTDIRTPDRRTRGLVTIPNTLPRLPSEYAEDIVINVHELSSCLVYLFTCPVPNGQGTGRGQRGSGCSEEEKKIFNEAE